MIDAFVDELRLSELWFDRSRSRGNWPAFISSIEATSIGFRRGGGLSVRLGAMSR